MKRREFLTTVGAGAAGMMLGSLTMPRRAEAQQTAGGRPNILVMMSDDQSYMHTSRAGSRMVRTPHFDRVANEGAFFTHAYCNAPSCSPSRASLLTGQEFWRLEEGSQLWGYLPQKFDVYPELLQKAGYHVGSMGKGYGPSKHGTGDREVPPAGPIIPRYDLDGFLDEREPGQPFCVFFGSSDPHRGYKPELKEELGIRPEDMEVPPFLPDSPEVRADLADYAAEVTRFDSDCGKWMKVLEDRGLLDDTIVIITSDNGIPFPRAKKNLYDAGTRMPMAIRWPGHIEPGTVIDRFVTFSDVAPTLMEAAGLAPTAEMTGASFLGLLEGRDDPHAERHSYAVTGIERHGWSYDDGGGYPMRAIRTDEYLYIRNYEPEKWPGPDLSNAEATSNEPAPAYMLAHRDAPAVRPYVELAWAKRPAEELYHMRTDPNQVRNVADEPAHAQAKQQLSEKLVAFMKDTGDPRAFGRGEIFKTYPYGGKKDSD